MKILNVNMTIDPVTGGGTAERTFQVSRFMARAGIECSILTLDIDITHDLIQSIGRVNVVAIPCLNKRFYLPKLYIKYLIQIQKIIKGVDVIHIMSHWTFLNIVVYFFARRLGKPYVLCPGGSLIIFGRSKILKLLYNLVIGRRIIKNAVGYIAITANEIPYFQTYGINPEKVLVIPNGIDMNEYSKKDDELFYKKYRLSSNPFILFVGRLNPIKGPDLLLRAFANVKDIFEHYHLIFAGPNEGLLYQLKEMAREYDMANRVHFLGYIDKNEKSIAYHAADIVVIPSRHEAMSIVVLEAGITGTPVLLTDRCGFNEVETVNGGKVVPASVEGLQRGLIEMLSDKARLKLMGENLKKHITENFTWDMLIDKYLIFYKKILDFKVV